MLHNNTTGFNIPHQCSDGSKVCCCKM